MRPGDDLSDTLASGPLAKKKSVHASEQDRPDVKARRQTWHQDLGDIPADQLVFIDESGAQIDMQRRRGRAPRGERLVAAAPAGHWKIATIISAVRLSGPDAAVV